MILKAKPIEDELIEDSYIEGMKVFNDFWGINWINNTPDVIVLESREDIDKVYGKKTQSWVRAWARNRTVYILSFDNITTESSHSDSKEEYQATIRHEIGHLFTNIVTNGESIPKWLNEGISTYLADQLLFNKKPDAFTGFLESNQTNHKPAYVEGGYVVELLLTNFGKAKFIDFVKSLGTNESFKRIYGFELTYDNINIIYKSNILSKNEAIEKLEPIINKHLNFKVKPNGALELKFPQNLISIEYGWHIWGDGGEFHSFDFTSLKDESNIENFIGKSKIVGLEIVNDGIFSLSFENDIKLSITDTDSAFYFRLFSFKPEEPTLALTSNFKFIQLSDNLS